MTIVLKNRSFSPVISPTVASIFWIATKLPFLSTLLVLSSPGWPGLSCFLSVFNVQLEAEYPFGPVFKTTKQTNRFSSCFSAQNFLEKHKHWEQRNSGTALSHRGPITCCNTTGRKLFRTEMLYGVAIVVLIC